MPYKSKSQMRKFFLLQKQGRLPPGTAEEWLRKTKNIKRLPNRVKKQKAKKR